MVVLGMVVVGMVVLETVGVSRYLFSCSCERAAQCKGDINKVCTISIVFLMYCCTISSIGTGTCSSVAVIGWYRVEEMLTMSVPFALYS
jgi:hypothetical protein